MQRKRVLFLASWYPSRENDLLGSFVQRHAEAAQRVADVTVLYAVSSREVTSVNVERKTVSGVDTTIVYYPKVRYRMPGIRELLSRKKYLDALKKGFAKIDEKFDLVHLNEAFPAGIFALLLKKERGLQYVLTAHWTGYLDHTNHYKYLPRVVRNIHRRIFAGASWVMPVSEHLGKSLRNLGLIRTYQVIPNVVNSDLFYPRPKKSTGIRRFLHISSFDNKHKNIEGMMAGFRKMQDSGQDFILHLITEGSRKEAMGYLKKAGVDPEKCLIDLRSSSAEVAEAMRAADCLVLFSNYETFSVVMAEAWMSGVPAIYSRCGGLTELTDPSLGTQVEKGDTAALAEALMAFHPEHYHPNEIAARAHRFSEEHVARDLGMVYEGVAP